MKCSEVRIIIDAEHQPTFTENTESCIDLHLVYRDGMACVNFVNEEGIRVNYDYPICRIKRCAHKANSFHSVKH